MTSTVPPDHTHVVPGYLCLIFQCKSLKSQKSRYIDWKREIKRSLVLWETDQNEESLWLKQEHKFSFPADRYLFLI